MPLPNIPVPTYPNVPRAPGVPPVLRQAGAVQNTAVVLVADAVQIARLFQGPRWGLFTQAGAPALSGTGLAGGFLSNVVAGLGLGGQSVVDAEYAQDNPIASAPQERGAFVSYNKVERPFRGRITYVVDGPEGVRGAFLQQVRALQASLTMLNLVMPEITYAGCNVVHHDLRRSARRGLTMIAVDIWVEQVRETGTVAFSNGNTKSPSGADPKSGGTVQPIVNPVAPENQPFLPAGALT